MTEPYKPSGPFIAKVSIAVLIIIAAFLSYFAIIFYSEASDKASTYLGKQVVVGSDTLIVTGFDLEDGEFYLSNGATASDDYLDKFIVE